LVGDILKRASRAKKISVEVQEDQQESE